MQIEHDVAKKKTRPGDAGDPSHGLPIEVADPHAHGVAGSEAYAPVVPKVHRSARLGHARKGKMQGTSQSKGGCAGIGIGQDVRQQKCNLPGKRIFSGMYTPPRARAAYARVSSNSVTSPLPKVSPRP